MSALLHLQWVRGWNQPCPAHQPRGWPSNERHAVAERQRLPLQGPADWDVDSERPDQTTAGDIIFPPEGPALPLSSSPDTVSSAPTFRREVSKKVFHYRSDKRGPALRRCVTPRSRGVFWRKWRRLERCIDVAGNVLNQRRAVALVPSSTYRACKSQAAAGRRL